ncbi:hypothetical protein Tco_0290799 [Tanacetum coccineum]
MKSKEQDTSNKLGNDAHADDVDIRPIYDEEPMAEVQMTVEINVFAIGQQHTEQPEFNNEGEVDQNVEQCHDTCPLPAKLTDNQNTKLSYQSLKSENICLKKTVTQFQKDFLRMEAHCVNLELKYQNQALKEGQHVNPPNGSDEDITNQYECEQTLDVSVAMTSDHNSSELGIHDHSNEPSSSKLVPKVVSPAARPLHHDKKPEELPKDTSILEIAFLRRPYALSWKPCQGDSLNLPDHRIHKDGDGDASFQLESDSLPHAHA